MAARAIIHTQPYMMLTLPVSGTRSSQGWGLKEERWGSGGGIGGGGEGEGGGKFYSTYSNTPIRAFCNQGKLYALAYDMRRETCLFPLNRYY